MHQCVNNQKVPFLSVKQVAKLLTLTVISTGGLCACANTNKYPASEFSSANHVITKTVKVPALPHTVVEASYGYGNNPALIKAYQTFVKTGKAPNVYTDGFVSFPYEPNQQPIVACQPLRACIIQLQSGEKINKDSVVMGDTARWQVQSIYTGEAFPNGAFSLVIKPEAYGISSNLIFATNKRTYDVALVSIDPSTLIDTCDQGQKTSNCEKFHTYDRKVTFYYPYETLSNHVDQENAIAKDSDTNPQSTLIAKSTNINLSHVNFNYAIDGDATWKPVRVFDDGQHTFIQMPGIARTLDLPSLYVAKGSEKGLVNFRYKAPYYVVDGLFKQAYLLAGVGSDQEKVTITNNNLS